ncbi:MAG TPA: FtsX-like permease family protein [Thermoanaerobaculia bacterium]|nr:FtsX-like permease family protein [Thermoanaerobaculia bacterium]
MSERRGGAARGLPFELWIALRYLRSARSDAFIHLLARITAGGLAVGVAALILALAALSGFQSRLLADIRERTPRLELLAPPEVDLQRLRELALGAEGVASAQELLYGRGWLRSGGRIEAVEIIAYQERLPGFLPIAEGAGAAPAASGPGVWISSTTALRWGLGRGDTVELVSPRITLLPRGPVPRSRRLEILGLHDAGLADERNAQRVALPLELAAGPGGLLVESDRRLELALARDADEARVAAALQAELAGDAAVAGAVPVTWLDANRALRFVLRLEKTAIFLAVVLIVLVASFALVGALSLILTSKRAEVGILSAMGARRRALRRVFLLLGAALATIGAGSGALAGIALAWSLDRWGLLRLPGEVYIVDHVPFEVRAGDVAVVMAATVAVTLVAAAVGARKTGTLDPVEALRR